jgi:hypothetical protein
MPYLNVMQKKTLTEIQQNVLFLRQTEMNRLKRRNINWFEMNCVQYIISKVTLVFLLENDHDVIKRVVILVIKSDWYINLKSVYSW